MYLKFREISHKVNMSNYASGNAQESVQYLVEFGEEGLFSAILVLKTL